MLLGTQVALRLHVRLERFRHQMRLLHLMILQAAVSVRVPRCGPGHARGSTLMGTRQRWMVQQALDTRRSPCHPTRRYEAGGVARACSNKP